MTIPDDDAKLNETRSTKKLKHVIMGNKLWNGLTSDFTIIISSVPFLWEYIKIRVNISTMVRD